MKFMDLWQQARPTISFEFYPGQSEKSTQKLHSTISTLLPLQPDFLSVTFGAGGSSRLGSLELLRHLKNVSTYPLAGYLAAYGLSREELLMIANNYAAEGVNALFAVRGDIPQENPILPHPHGCTHAADLVRHLKNNCTLPVGVAAYPEGHIEAKNKREDWRHLHDKIEIGADFIITQYFYNNSPFYELRNFLRDQGVKSPVLAGIMPIYNSKLTYSLAEKCGARIPNTIRARLDSIPAEDKEQLNAFGIDLALTQCRDLLKNGVDGLHFYTMDRSQSICTIIQTLRKENLI